MKALLLGDPFSGKTCLSRALAGLPFLSKYEPTVGTDIYPSEEVTICDCSGRERFTSAPTDTTVVCVLVIDGVDGKVESLNGWHDEFLQYFGPRAKYVVAVSRKDVRSRSLALSEVSMWCNDTIPFVEVSAATGDGLGELCACIAHAAEEAESVDALPEVGERVLGWYDNHTDLWEVAVDAAGSSNVRIPTDPPLYATTDRPSMVGASIVCMCFRSHEGVTKDTITQVQTTAMAACGVMDVASIAWCVVCNSTEHSPNVIYKVASLCTRMGVGLFFLSSEDTEERVADFWGKIYSFHNTISCELQLDRIPISSHSCSNTGCQWNGPLADVFRHEVLCEHKVIMCRFEGCGKSIEMGERIVHEKQCPMRPTTCPFCELTFTGTLNDHSDHCPKKVVYKAEYTRCPLSTFGCHSEPMPRTDLNSHLDQGHMRIVSNALSYLSDENKELRAKCFQLEATLAEERKARLELGRVVSTLQTSVSRLEKQ